MGGYALMDACQASHRPAYGHGQCMPTHALTSQNRNMFNYNYTITPYLFC